MGVTLYFAMGPDQALCDLMSRCVCNTNDCGILFTWVNVNVDLIESLARTRTKTRIFLDCGAFEAHETKRTLYVSKPISKYAIHINTIARSLWAEPDFICNDRRTLASDVALLRYHELISHIDKDRLSYAVRPVHGRTVKERIEYYKTVSKYFRPNSDYVALGNLFQGNTSNDDIFEMAKQLSAEGVRRLHLFAMTSPDSIRLAFEISKFMDHVSIDGSTWQKKATMNRSVYVFDEASGTLPDVKFMGNKGSVDPKKRKRLKATALVKSNPPMLAKRLPFACSGLVFFIDV